MDDRAAEVAVAELEHGRRPHTMAERQVSGRGINADKNKESSRNANKDSWDGGRDSSVCVQENGQKKAFEEAVNKAASL